MKRLLLLCMVFPFFLACSTLSNPQTTSQAKENLFCLEYTSGMPWEQVQQAFGDPSFTPLPEPGTGLNQNARGYNNVKIFFYTKPQRTEEEGKVRFKEVVYKVEICKGK